MENYSLNDIKAFLKNKGYYWNGIIWSNGTLPHKVKNIAELYSRTNPIILFVLRKNKRETLQYISVFDTRFEFWQEAGLFSTQSFIAKNFNHSHFVMQQDYSTEWADFLALRHNTSLNA